MSNKLSVYQYIEFREYLEARMRKGQRGLQAQMARAANCQAIHIIKVIKGNAQLTEDQAFRIGKFLKLNEAELSYFLDLTRLSKAAEPETRSYFKKRLQVKADASHEVKNRVKGIDTAASLEDQIRYFCSPTTSLIHLGTSCKTLQTPLAISKWLGLSLEEVRSALNFLLERDFVELREGRYLFKGKDLHLPKESPIHAVFQKHRREWAMQGLNKAQEKGDLYFSSAFATTPEHFKAIRTRLLEVIEETHSELEKTGSEEVSVLIIDFLSMN